MIRPAPSSLCVVRDLIERQADERPDRIFALFGDGSKWTFRELRTRVLACALALQRLGVRKGDFVLLWLTNGPTALATFFATNYLGAIAVPINTSYRGKLLEHVIAKTGATLMVAHGALIERLVGAEIANLKTIVAMGPRHVEVPGLSILGEEALTAPDIELLDDDVQIDPWDTHLVLFTSGTTGVSKGVLASYLHSFAVNQGFRHQTPEDRHLVTLPLFHVAGAVTLYFALAQGASLALLDGFSTTTFWDTVNRFEATTTGLLGTMIQFLLKQPPSPEDRRHTLKKALVAPMDQTALVFAERFGVEVYQVYNMTELSVPMLAGPNPDPALGCGKLRAGYDARVVDEHDFEVPHGQTGELILRTSRPWELLSGYLGEPAATAAAWRNGWFHTGDVFFRDEAGNFHYFDRLKDSIRRRGENISSFEVEREILSHPHVREVAVVPVPAAQYEDEILAVVSSAPHHTIDPASLLEYLRPRVPYFMVPRYIRILPDLPKTPSQKVQKYVLRQAGVTPDTWDRERAGITIRRDRLD